MIVIMETVIKDRWDERHWQLALKAEKPIEVYTQIRADMQSAQDATAVDDLPPEHRDWLRST